MTGQVERPSHYIAGGIEARRVIQAYRLGWELGTAVKYILRAGRKTSDAVTDLRKCREYLLFAIECEAELEVSPKRLLPRWVVPDEYRPQAVARAFGLSERRAKALGAILCGFPHREDAESALAEIEAEIEALSMEMV